MGQVGWEDHNHTALLQFPLCAWKGRKKSPQTTMELDSVLPESGKSKVWRLKEPLPSGARLRPPSRREQSCWQQMRLQPYISPLSSCCAAQAGFVLMFLALCSFLIQVAVFIASFSPMHWFCLLFFSPSSHHYSSFVSGQKSKKVHLSSDISVSAFFFPILSSVSEPQGQLTSNLLYAWDRLWKETTFLLLSSLGAKETEVEWNNSSFTETQRKKYSFWMKEGMNPRSWGLYPLQEKTGSCVSCFFDTTLITICELCSTLMVPAGPEQGLPSLQQLCSGQLHGLNWVYCGF